MPVDGNRLVALVDDSHRDLITLVPDKVRSRGLTVDEPHRTSSAIGIVRAVGNLHRLWSKSYSKAGQGVRTYGQSVLAKRSLDYWKNSPHYKERDASKLHFERPNGVMLKCC
jgi:hypothetical protein